MLSQRFWVSTTNLQTTKLIKMILWVSGTGKVCNKRVFGSSKCYFKNSKFYYKTLPQQSECTHIRISEQLNLIQ